MVDVNLLLFLMRFVLQINQRIRRLIYAILITKTKMNKSWWIVLIISNDVWLLKPKFDVKSHAPLLFLFQSWLCNLNTKLNPVARDLSLFKTLHSVAIYGFVPFFLAIVSANKFILDYISLFVSLLHSLYCPLHTEDSVK